MRVRIQSRANANRARILAAVHAQPGACYRELVRVSGLAAGTARHHLRTLRLSGQLHELRDGMRILHFPTGFTRSPALAALRREPGLDALARFVAAHPGASQRQVLDAFHDEPRSTTQHRLHRLVTLGVVRIQHHGGYHALFVDAGTMANLQGPGADAMPAATPNVEVAAHA